METLMLILGLSYLNIVIVICLLVAHYDDKKQSIKK